MEIQSYHYGKIYAMSLRVFIVGGIVKSRGRLPVTAILKYKGKELSASTSLFCTSFSGICKKGLLPHCRGREACRRKSSSLL